MRPLTGTQADSSALPSGFVRLSQFIPGVVLDIRYHGSDNFLGMPVAGYTQPEAILCLPAALALQKVQAALQTFGFGLKIFDAYRPQQAVAHFLRWEHEPEDPAIAARFHPDFSKQELFAQGYIATRSSHTRGSTVDLTLVADGSHGLEELDMGTEFDFFGRQSAPDYAALPLQQRSNRLLLRQIMMQYGFRGFGLEWWHFTLANEPFPNQYFDFPIT